MMDWKAVAAGAAGGIGAAGAFAFGVALWFMYQVAAGEAEAASNEHERWEHGETWRS